MNVEILVWECTVGCKNVDIHVVPRVMGEFKGGRDGKNRVVIREGGVYGGDGENCTGG